MEPIVRLSQAGSSIQEKLSKFQDANEVNIFCPGCERGTPHCQKESFLGLPEVLFLAVARVGYMEGTGKTYKISDQVNSNMTCVSLKSASIMPVGVRQYSLFSSYSLQPKVECLALY